MEDGWSCNDSGLGLDRMTDGTDEMTRQMRKISTRWQGDHHVVKGLADQAEAEDKLELEVGQETIEDVEELMPGLIKATVEWFKNYKIPDGEWKMQNHFCS